MSALLLAEVGSLQKTINTYLRGDEGVRIFNYAMTYPASTEMDDFLTTNGYDAGLLVNDAELFSTVQLYPQAMGSFFGSQTAMDTIAENSGAVNTIISDQFLLNEAVATAVVMNAFGASQLARDAIAVNQNAMDAVNASNMTIGKYVAGVAGLVPADYADMDAVVASQAALDAVVASQAALDAVVASQAALDAVVAGQLAVDVVVASQTALDSLDASSPINVPILTGTDARAVASTSYDSTKYYPWNSFDNDLTTGWAQSTQGNINDWLSWDFGVPVWCYRALYQPAEAGTGVTTDRIPDEAVFECADSINGPWEVASTVAPDTTITTEQRFLLQNAVGKKRFWRMRNTSMSSGYYFTVGKLQFWGKA